MPFQKVLIIKFYRTQESKAEDEVDRLFKLLCSKENDTIRPRSFIVQGRNVTFNRTCGRILDTAFEEICDRPLGAGDYLQLSKIFHTIIIRGVPQLNLKLKSPARRFITLIDTLYDSRVRVIICANEPLSRLFSKERDVEVQQQTVAVDDINVSGNQVCWNQFSTCFLKFLKVFCLSRPLAYSPVRKSCLPMIGQCPDLVKCKRKITGPCGTSQASLIVHMTNRNNKIMNFDVDGGCNSYRCQLEYTRC